jgi:hypothetical protein
MPTRHPACAGCCLAAAVALSTFGTCARAEGPQDRYWAELEYFFPTISSTARLDFPNTNIRGTEIALEDDLGLSDRKGAPYLLLGMRLGQAWRLEFEYYQLNRTASRTINRTINWGQVTFPASATVSSKFDTDVYRLTGGWSFYRTAQAEGGASLGLHVTQFDMAIAGQGNGPAGLAFQSEGRDQLVPLPTIGLYGNYMLSDRWVLRGRVDYLSLNYESYDGSLTNWMAAVDWRITPNWTAGVGYRYVDYKLESTKENFKGRVQYKFKGPTLYMGATF